MANTYNLGDKPRLTLLLTDALGTAVDPTGLTVKTKDPNGVVTAHVFGTDVNVVKDSAGNYHFDVDANLVGTWHYRWEATGTGQAAAENTFIVRASSFS